jgi:dTDP-4-amino-4,6-dideoxygalactose transaminase
MAERHEFDDGFNDLRSALKWWAGVTTSPTSSLTGGGAIAALEHQLGELLGGYALALPSGSAAVTAALRILGAELGSRVRLAKPSWFGDAGLVRSVGAEPVDDSTAKGADIVMTGLWTDDDAKSLALAARLLEPKHAASTAPVIVDAADLAPCRWTTMRAEQWDALTLSFGPGKPIDGGEGGALVTRDRQQLLAAIRLTQHPVRQRLAGITEPDLSGPFERMHPATAIVVLHHLQEVGHVR